MKEEAKKTNNVWEIYCLGLFCGLIIESSSQFNNWIKYLLFLGLPTLSYFLLRRYYV